jgi:hypothetical protein
LAQVAALVAQAVLIALRVPLDILKGFYKPMTAAEDGRL